MNTNEAQYILVILATVWASFNTTHAVITEINKTRNQIITGKIDGDSISIPHREMLLNLTWVPLYRGLASRAFIFALVLFALPFFVKNPSPFLICICIISGLFPAISVVDFFYNGSKEKEALAEIVKKEDTGNSMASQ